MGGDCLNVGCVPSKCLVAAAKALNSCRKASSLGVVGAGDVSIDFPRVMKRMRDIRGGIAPHDGVARYGRDFCEAVIIGEAAFVSETEVVITARDGSGRTQTVAFDRCMVATGASAALPPAPGLLETPHLTNGNFFNLEALPPTLGLIGAGPIGLEMAQSLQRFGCQVTVFEMAPRLLPREDADAAQIVGECLQEDGVAIHTGCRVLSVQGGPQRFCVVGVVARQRTCGRSRAARRSASILLVERVRSDGVKQLAVVPSARGSVLQQRSQYCQVALSAA